MRDHLSWLLGSPVKPPGVVTPEEIQEPQEPQEKKQIPLPATDNLSFSEALELLKEGHQLQRSGWCTQHVFIFLAFGQTATADRQPPGIPKNIAVDYLDYIAVYIPQAGTITPWSPPPYDILASDWQVFKHER